VGGRVLATGSVYLVGDLLAARGAAREQAALDESSQAAG